MDYGQIKIDAPVVEPGTFSFAAIGLEHGHIYGMCRGVDRGWSRIERGV